MLTAKPRADLTPHWALWVIARDMATNAPFPVGYWTGDDATTITVGGQHAPTGGVITGGASLVELAGGLAQHLGGASGRLAGLLYVDSLSGPTGPVPTYLDLLDHDLETITRELTS